MPAPSGPIEAERLSRAQAQVDAVQDFRRPVAGAQPFHPDRRFATRQRIEARADARAMGRLFGRFDWPQSALTAPAPHLLRRNEARGFGHGLQRLAAHWIRHLDSVRSKTCARRQTFARSASTTGVRDTLNAGRIAASTVATRPTANPIASTEGTIRMIAV